MTKRWSPHIQKRLDALDKSLSRRSLLNRAGKDFASNDYLGLSTDPDFRSLAFELIQNYFAADRSRFPIGASGSRLLRGQLEIFDEVESLLAEFSGAEASTLFPSGYQANLCLFSALLRPGDVVFSDQYNHASMIDGIRLSGARKKVYPHLDVKSLRRLLEDEWLEAKDHSAEDGLRVIATESVFSMDGDLAPLREIVELAEEFSALVVVDEAHATGLWGDFERNQGGGQVQALGLGDQVFAAVHPAGKAMGVGGAWVSGSSQLKDYLINHSRPFIFSTAPVPILAVLLKASVQYWKKVGRQRAAKVLELSGKFRTLLYEKVGDLGELGEPGKYEGPGESERLGEEVGGRVQWKEIAYSILKKASGPIIPLILGENSRALSVAQDLRAAGFDARAIRPPTVPQGSARIRFTVNWNMSMDDLDLLVGHLALSIEQKGRSP